MKPEIETAEYEEKEVEVVDVAGGDKVPRRTMAGGLRPAIARPSARLVSMLK